MYFFNKWKITEEYQGRNYYLSIDKYGMQIQLALIIIIRGVKSIFTTS